MAEENGTTPPAQSDTPLPVIAASEPAPAFPNALDWRQGLHEELRTNPDYNKTLEVYRDQNAFVRDAIRWRSEMSRRVRIPGEGATAEERQAFLRQAFPDYPEEAKAYASLITLPEVPPDFDGNPQQWDQDLLQQVYEEAHVRGAPAHVVQGFLELYARHMAQAKNVLEAREAQTDEGQRLEMAKRFGASLKTRQNQAQYYFQRITNSELGEKCRGKFMDVFGNDPDMIEFFALKQTQSGEPADLINDGYFPAVPTREEVSTKRTDLVNKAFDPKLSTEERQAAVLELRRLEEHAAAFAGAR